MSLTYKGRHIRLVTYLSTETWQTRREWQEILNMMNRENMQPRIFYPTRLSFRMQEEIKTSPDQTTTTTTKLKEFVTSKPVKF